MLVVVYALAVLNIIPGTSILLDRVAELVRWELGLSAEQLPLAAVLEGGTWAAGRELARKLRADGGPPLRVISDGTVF